MSNFILNSKKEKLYMFVESHSDTLEPSITLSTWEECLKLFKEKMKSNGIKEVPFQIVNEKLKSASATLKYYGVNGSYTIFIFIKVAYSTNW